MKTLKTLLFIPVLLLSSWVYSATTLEETKFVDFGGGLNIKTNPSSIDDNESPDMSNFVNELYGSSVKRNGSSRYISQALSTQPVTSLFRTYITSGTNTIKATFVSNNDSIYLSTTDTFWVRIASGFRPNQRYSFDQMNNKVIWSGDGQTDPMYQYDLLQSSLSILLSGFVSTDSVNIFPKYILNASNYLIAGNVAQKDLTAGVVQATTYSASRIMYTAITDQSSFTRQRFIDFEPGNGDFITGMGFLNKELNIFEQNSIFQVDFSALNLLAQGGDQKITKIVAGFGCIAPYTIDTDGNFYYFLSKQGIVQWDGGNRNRLNITEEARVISTKIQPIIDDLIKTGRYANCAGRYYPKRQWYLFAFEDPAKFPKGVNNTVMAYDIINQTWFRLDGWNAASLESMDGANDQGKFIYGDSTDGYVYYLDDPNSANDSRKETSISPLDNEVEWLRSSQDTGIVVEGTASVRITVSPTVGYSSTSYIKVIDLSEFKDKTPTKFSDKISFKVYPTTLSALTQLRFDLSVGDVDTDFNSIFSSVTISSADLTAGNTSWSTIEIPLSSFTILDEWVNLNTEIHPFANTKTFYGIRFYATGTSGLALNFDDLRLIGGSQAPISAYRYTKQYSLETIADKNFRQLVLDAELQPNTNFNIDVIGNFGELNNRTGVRSGFDKQFYVSGYNGNENLTKLEEITFDVLDSTTVSFSSEAAFRAIEVDDSNIYATDRYNNRLIKISKYNLNGTSFTSVIGTGGSGNDQFYNAWQLAVDEKDSGYLYVADSGNHRVKVHNKSDLSFVQSFGTLGTGATNFHVPTGVAVDQKYLYVGDDGNHRIIKLDKSTGAFISSASVDINTFGSLVLHSDSKFIYDFFQTISATSTDFVDVILEKRDKNSLSVINRIRVTPQFYVGFSTYNIMGNISGGGDFIYIPFTDDANGNGSYYLQKRLKSDFSIVKELKSSKALYGIASIGYDYKPSRRNIYTDLGIGDANYIQIRYSEETQLDNPLRLNSQAFLFIRETLQEKH